MAPSIKVDRKKKRGRPATGRGVMLSTRVPQATAKAIAAWAKEHETTRSDAIRRLVELGLAKATAPPAKSFTAKTGRTLRNVEQDLDDALGNTFPASDPVEMEEPAVRTGQPRAKRARK